MDHSDTSGGGGTQTVVVGRWKCLKLVAFVENVGLPSVGIAPQSGEHWRCSQWGVILPRGFWSLHSSREIEVQNPETLKVNWNIWERSNIKRVSVSVRERWGSHHHVEAQQPDWVLEQQICRAGGQKGPQSETESSQVGNNRQKFCEENGELEWRTERTERERRCAIYIKESSPPFTSLPINWEN